MHERWKLRTCAEIIGTSATLAVLDVSRHRDPPSSCICPAVAALITHLYRILEVQGLRCHAPLFTRRATHDRQFTPMTDIIVVLLEFRSNKKTDHPNNTLRSSPPFLDSGGRNIQVPHESGRCPRKLSN